MIEVISYFEKSRVYLCFSLIREIAFCSTSMEHGKKCFQSCLSAEAVLLQVAMQKFFQEAFIGKLLDVVHRTNLIKNR